MNNSESSILLYDGDCGICREWVNYWNQLTEGRVVYNPYQSVKEQYRDISEDELAAAIHLVQSDGTISKGAEATFALYKNVPPYSVLLLLYRHLPGFALLAEFAYKFFSTHRGLLAFITHLFWGRDFKPSRYEFISNLFLRCLGLIYLIAFISFYVQASALIGSEGILPLEYYLNAVREEYGSNAYLALPTLFWFSHSDQFIQLVCLSGIGLSILLVTGFLQRISLILLYILYLSIVNAGQVFMTFQWDILLLECGFLAIFLSWGSRIIIWLYRWLVFRFMFLGGVVKIVSGDPSWDNITALFYHFETQPLPLPLSWYVHHLPENVLIVATALTLIVELVLPFFIFFPRRFRHSVGIIFILFQMMILLTGNYNFFNLLTIFICLFLFDDTSVRWLFPVRFRTIIGRRTIKTPGYLASSFAIVMLVISLYMGGTQIGRFIDRDESWQPSVAYQFFAPFNIVNSYGPFAVMTRVRHEIILEGSFDKTNWQEYEFKYKPGDLDQCPVWVQPHQPRVDWQMWFAALSPPERQRWLFNMMIRMLQGSKPVLEIFSHNPFQDKPPTSIRA
ncbi:MAG: lipase maturation factor family protein, partial [Thiotrichales bacterium]|nr:lipase maturation factor family protein [Thiotrichales bacterium]